MFPKINQKLWKKNLGHLAGKKNLNYLEIGSYEGQSLTWVLNNFLHPSCQATVVEPFCVSETKKTFYQNISRLDNPRRVTVLENWSQDILPFLKPHFFDLIYIDGSHKAEDVWRDAKLSWPLLKANGYLVFDDYYWMKWILKQEDRPQFAIDQFLAVMNTRALCLAKGIQVFVQKKAELPDHFPAYSHEPSTEVILPQLISKQLHRLIYGYYSCTTR